MIHAYFCFLKGKLNQITVPGTDKIGLLGPVLNMQGLLECPYCDYTTDKKANWYKHKKRHSGTSYIRFRCTLFKIIAIKEFINIMYLLKFQMQ